MTSSRRCPLDTMIFGPAIIKPSGSFDNLKGEKAAFGLCAVLVFNWYNSILEHAACIAYVCPGFSGGGICTGQTRGAKDNGLLFRRMSNLK